ncbi:hypothetical protein M3N64_01605 [Sporolactobacillus sp. CPB3-1]|uniref:PepSY domain-containing protein n=1 Tax=Sporolactobacillus mangiferae TaxID=2940498 RepID=A0ABT0M8R5_9BACL|nr:hypothetical protein [Sporolactobacillus mangiferae]MCL1630649.1 hypothetical protein [Sporolactobacillus mangiferae]
MSNHFNKTLIIGVIAGYIAGMTVTRIMNGKITLSSEQVLERVKHTAKNQLSFDGAWICLTPHIWSNDQLNHLVYKGGLICNEQGKNHHYDFVADAKSGTILQLKSQRRFSGA